MHKLQSQRQRRGRLQLSEWKLKITCPRGHDDLLMLYYDEYELRISCSRCNNQDGVNIWEELDEEFFKKVGVKLQ